MRPKSLLWLNWKCWHHPRAGGAEEFTKQVALRLAKKGYKVTLLTSSFPAAGKECKGEVGEGIRLLHRGGLVSVRLFALFHYLKHESEYDKVIDEINTIPFFTPEYVPSDSIRCLIHQLAKESWMLETPFPLNWIGYHILEPWWLRSYRRIRTMTVSPSTAKELREMGFIDITILPQGVTRPSCNIKKQEEELPTLLYMARLTRAKLPHHALEAYRYIREEVPNCRLWVVGDGPLKAELMKEAYDGITFLGRVGPDERFLLLSKAHLLLCPGVREGWGLTVSEAGLMETPAIAYRIPGYIDSIKDGETGLLVKASPKEMAKAAVKLLKDDALRWEMGRRARELASGLSWDKTTDAFEEVLRS